MNTENHLVLHIVGMRGEECTRKVAEELLGVEGVDDATVDLESRTAEVDLNPDEPATEEALTAAVQAAGFHIERVEHAAFGG